MLTPIVMENSQIKVKLSNPDDVMRRELNDADFRPLMKQGEMQQRLLDPLSDEPSTLARRRGSSPTGQG